MSTVRLFERLVCARVEVPGRMKTPCWVWPKSVCNKGYGQTSVTRNGKTNSKRAHIAAWELAKGRRVRKGFTLDHLCRLKRCWRPSHMEEITRSENTARGNRDNPRSTVKALEAKRLRRACLAGAPIGVSGTCDCLPDS